jgi:hypothetical protein
MDIKEKFSEWGINAIAATAALIGSFIHITMDEKQLSFRSALAQIISAFAFGGYGTEWFAKWLGFEEKASVCGLLGLCLGICGIYAARGVIKIGKRFESNPVKFIKNKGGDNVADS